MSAEPCGAGGGYTSTPLGPIEKAAYKILNNRIVEAVLVAAIAVGFIATAVADGILGTRAERRLIESLRNVSRGRLGSLRKAQIKYVFRCQFGMRKIKVRLAGGSYWLSIPCVVEGRRGGVSVKYMAKIINGMSAIKHRYMTMLRNLGVIAGAADLRFDEYADAKDMVDFERYCLARLKEQSLNTPAVIGMYRLNEDDYMLVTEYIEGEPLSTAPLTGREIDEIFDIIKKMHDSQFVHGDIKLDNLIVSRGKIFVVDCLKIGPAALAEAKSFDLVCALCALCQKALVSTVLDHARRHFSEDQLLRAGMLLDVAVSKVDIDLPEQKVKELRRALGSPV